MAFFEFYFITFIKQFKLTSNEKIIFYMGCFIPLRL